MKRIHPSLNTLAVIIAGALSLSGCCPRWTRENDQGESATLVSRRIVESLAAHHQRQEVRADNESDVVDSIIDDRILVRVRTHRAINELVVSIICNGRTQMVWTRGRDGLGYVFYPDDVNRAHIELILKNNSVCSAKVTMEGREVVLWEMEGPYNSLDMHRSE